MDMEEQTNYVKFTGIREGTVTLTAKLYNGYTTSKTIRVYVPEMCRDGHEPYWRVTASPTMLNNGKREQFCSRCGLLMGSEPIPCTGNT